MCTIASVVDNMSVIVRACLLFALARIIDLSIPLSNCSVSGRGPNGQKYKAKDKLATCTQQLQK